METALVVRAWMVRVREQYSDRCGPNPSALASAAALEFSLAALPLDEHHWLWPLAFVVAESPRRAVRGELLQFRGSSASVNRVSL